MRAGLAALRGQPGLLRRQAEDHLLLRLGTRLLQRTTRQIALTEAGRGFHERVQAILASVEEAENWVAQRAHVARGPLRVSAPTTFGRLHVAFTGLGAEGA